MRILIIIAIALLLPIYTTAYARVVAIPIETGIPEISYGASVSKAEQYLADQKINVTNHFLGSIDYNFRSGLPSFWRLEWRLKKAFVKGGQVIVIVPTQGKITLSFGE